MEHLDNSKRCKWSGPSTNLLISIWSHDLVQKQLKSSTRNQPIWESIARFMTRKGYPVTGLQCRTRIKNMLCTYQEAIKKNNSSNKVPYFDIFTEILNKKGLKDQKSSNTIKTNYPLEVAEESDISKDSNSLELEALPTDNEYEMEVLEETSNDSQYFCKINIKNEIKDMQNAIVQAIDSQTKAILEAIKLQSQMIEKLVTADREKLESIFKLERESRKQLEMH